MKRDLTFTVKDRTKTEISTCVIRVNRKACAIVDQLCMETNRSRQEIASKLIEYAYEHCQVLEAEAEEEEE